MLVYIYIYILVYNVDLLEFLIIDRSGAAMGAYEADHTLGPIIFCLYITVILFIVMNALLGYDKTIIITINTM